MARVILLSDLHLSPTHGFFWDNFRRAREAVNAAAPDAVIVSGDLCINGPESDAEMEFAARAVAGLRGEVFALPGNHDVGDEPPGQDPNQIIDAARLSRWHRTFGADHFEFICGCWRVIGLNAQLFGSGLPEEASQNAWLADELSLDHDHPVALVLHKPLFIADPEGEVAPTPAAMTPAPRAWLRRLIDRSTVRMVISGHLHTYNEFVRDDVRYVWAPATSFVHGGAHGGEPIVGALSFDFSNEAGAVELMEIDGLVAHDLDALKGHGRYKFIRDMPQMPVAVA